MNAAQRFQIVQRLIELRGCEWVFLHGKLYRKKLPRKALDEMERLKSLLEINDDFPFLEKLSQRCGMQIVQQVPKKREPLNAETLEAQFNNVRNNHDYITGEQRKTINRTASKKPRRARERMPRLDGTTRD